MILKAKLMNVLQINTMNTHFMSTTAQSHTTEIGLSFKRYQPFVCAAFVTLPFSSRENPQALTQK